jgi:hypothetical protein
MLNEFNGGNKMPMRILKSGREDASDSAVKMAMESLARMNPKMAAGFDPYETPTLPGATNDRWRTPGNEGQPTPRSTATPGEIRPAGPASPVSHPVTPGQADGTSTTPEQVEAFIAANPEAARAIFANHPELAGKVTPQHPM